MKYTAFDPTVYLRGELLQLERLHYIAVNNLEVGQIVDVVGVIHPPDVTALEARITRVRGLLDGLA